MTIKSVGTSFGLLTAILLASAGSAHAGAIVFCNTSPPAPNIDLVQDGCISGTGNAYPNGGDGVYSNSGGGDDEAAVEQAILDAMGEFVDLSPLGKTNDSGVLAGFSFLPDAGAGLTTSQSGTWTQLSGANTVRFISIKAANSFAIYQYDTNVGTGSYTTMNILNNGGNQPDVSHISFWAGNPSTSTAPVPEPSSFLMFGAGLAGWALIRRRSRSRSI